MTDLALRTDLSDAQREYLSLVRSSTQSLLGVINDLLDFSRIEAGKLDLDPRPFYLRTELADALRPLALRAVDKGLELSYRVADTVPDRLLGDWPRLRQILTNLVGNAVKFTDQGEVFVKVAPEETGGEHEQTPVRKVPARRSRWLICASP